MGGSATRWRCTENKEHDELDIVRVVTLTTPIHKLSCKLKITG